MVTFERAAVVGAPVADVWDRVISSEGISDEMLPWMTMRLPRSAHGLTADTLPIGKVLGRAWILLFGAIPVELDRLAIVDLDPGHHFHEKSTTLSMRRWEHQRSLAQVDGSTTRITDRVTFEPRLWLMAPVMAKMLHAFFGHRHRRLQRYFGY